MNINFNMITNHTCFFLKEKIPSLSSLSTLASQHKKVIGIVLFAISCLAACYTLYRHRGQFFGQYMGNSTKLDHQTPQTIMKLAKKQFHDHPLKEKIEKAIERCLPEDGEEVKAVSFDSAEYTFALRGEHDKAEEEAKVNNIMIQFFESLRIPVYKKYLKSM